MRSDEPPKTRVGLISPQADQANGLSQPLQPAPRRPQSIWQNRDFLLLWLAQAISQTAQNAIWYGIVVLVQQRSHSSTQLSLAGVYVDRWDKRRVLIATNLIRGVIALSYGLFGLVPGLPLSLLFVINFA